MILLLFYFSFFFLKISLIYILLKAPILNKRMLILNCILTLTMKQIMLQLFCSICFEPITRFNCDISNHSHLTLLFFKQMLFRLCIKYCFILFVYIIFLCNISIRLLFFKLSHFFTAFFDWITIYNMWIRANFVVFLTSF